MKSAEGFTYHPHTERLVQWAEHEAPIMNLDQLRPTEMRHSVLDIDFQKWHERNVDTWFFDAEGTFTEHDHLDPDSDIVRHVKSAREQGFIQNIAVVSNKRPKDDTSYQKLAWWAHEIGADIVFTPLDKGDRKPSSRMMLKAMHYFGADPSQCAAVDDKFTAGILAANRAGIPSVKVDRFGKEDLPVDKWFTRPFEEIVEMGLAKTEPEDGPSAPDVELPLHYLRKHREESSIFVQAADDPGYETRHKKLTPAVVQLSSRIAGYGDCPAVRLPQEIEDAIPPSWHRPVTQPARDFIAWYQGKLDDIDPRIREKYAQIMYEYGHIVADAKSLARPLILGPLKADAVRDRKYARALALHATNIWADATDGRDKRRSKRGPNRLGGWMDQIGDKIEEYQSTSALVDVGAASEGDVQWRLRRNIGITGIRLVCEQFGIDVKAVLSGKIGTGAEMSATT
ncbi:HAD hydrolase-like protein, partial [Candidatus Microgenomates bacterium]|nr:HAD hydrolase-like protein [Candidatus Microgenomates bacterium]